MPEGHTIHRLARDLAADLLGRPVEVRSEQGSAQPIPSAQAALRAAQELDGRALEEADAHGKHLLLRFDGAPDALHVHLGLFGRFRRFDAPGPGPRPTDRLTLATPETLWRLAGATASRLLTPPDEEALRARLGPDPLRDDADPARFAAALARRRGPVAAALMRQDVVAGVGNMFRAEVLWALRLDPFAPSRAVDAAAVWAEVSEQLHKGVSRKRWQRGIYKQRACRRCGGEVATQPLDGRLLWWCPACQPAASSSTAPSSTRSTPATSARPRTTTPRPKVTSPRTTKRSASRSDGAPTGKRASSSGTSL